MLGFSGFPTAARGYLQQPGDQDTGSPDHQWRLLRTTCGACRKGRSDVARWLITGCSTGFGREIARAALEAGHSAVVTARRAEAVVDFADEFGDRARAAALDVTDAAAVQTAFTSGQIPVGRRDVRQALHRWLVG